MRPLSRLSAGGSITLGSSRIKMSLGRGERCHGHGMVGIRSDSGKPHPVHWCRLSSAYSSPDGAIVPAYHHDGYMSTVRLLARRAARAKPLAGASLSMTPPHLVPQIRASHYHAEDRNDIRFNRVIGESNQMRLTIARCLFPIRNNDGWFLALS
jgi:hypothetical protein